jgi:serine/threonine-protein kinase HipA
MQMSDTKTVSRVDFEEFGHRIGLASRLIKRELDTFATDIPLAKELIGRSFLSDALKRSYWLSYKYRRNTLYK